MTNTGRTSFEEAKICPKCGQPGEEGPWTKGPKPGSKVFHIYCRVKLCKWYNTPWMVQVDRDGTVPPPQDHSRTPKVYQGFEGHDQLAQQIVEALQAQVIRETSSDPRDHEIRNPNSR